MMVATIDFNNYPHIFALVVAHSDDSTRSNLRLLSKAAKREVDRRNDCHLWLTMNNGRLRLHTYKPEDDTGILPEFRLRHKRTLSKYMASPDRKLHAAFGYARLIKIPLETLEYMYASYRKPSTKRKLGYENHHEDILMPPPLVELVRKDCILELSLYAFEDSNSQPKHSIQLPYVTELRLRYWRCHRSGCTCAPGLRVAHHASKLRISMNETTEFCGVVVGVFGPTVEQLMLVVEKAESVGAYLKTIKGKPRNSDLRVSVKCHEKLAAEDIHRLEEEWRNLLGVPVKFKLQEGGGSSSGE